MKPSCVIRAEPRFYLSIDLAFAQLLAQLATLHYDHMCRSAGKPGGFIFGWVNILTPYEGQTEEDRNDLTVTASFSEMDLLLKIMELPPPMIASQAIQLNDFREMIHVCLRASNERMSKIAYTISKLPRDQRIAIYKSRYPSNDNGTYASVEQMLDAHFVPKFALTNIQQPLHHGN